MVPRAAMDAAHAAAVMVRAHGPDPKGRKMRRHAFFHTESGDTTLSASGFLSLRTAELEMDEKPFPLHRNQFDCTTVSCSSVVVVTCASIVEPFLSQQPYGTSPVEARGFPKLITGAEIDVLLEVPAGKPTADEYQSQCWIPARLERVVDIPSAGAALQSLLDVHGGSVDGAWEIGWALAPLEGNSQLQGLGTRALGARAIVDEPSRRWASVEDPGFVSPATNGIRVGSLSMTATRVAILSLSGKGSEAASSFQDSVFHQASERDMPSKVCFDLAVASSFKRGDFLLAVGSPFGALSPLHFHNSLSAGVVSNCWPPKSEPVALLMADVRCLPGMEGGPVFDEQGALVGMLTRPLRQRGGSAEVQLVMTSAVLAPALLDAGIALGVPSLHQNLPCDHDVAIPAQLNGTASSLEADSCRGTILSDSSPYCEPKPFMPLGIAQALNSVVLVTIGDGAWASGVIISKNGLILTNAHLLEPWRFGKMRSSHHHHTLLSSKCEGESAVIDEGKTNYDMYFASFDQLGGHGTLGKEVSPQDEYDQHLVSSCTSPSVFDLRGKCAQSEVAMKSTDMKWRGYQRIRVRLDHLQARSWHNAEAVYVSQGPLDIALLQLVSPPMGLCPIIPEESCPAPGSTAVVIGHGLFGPRAELSPSVSAGVVARVVKAGSQTLSRASNSDGDTYRACPAMLQTTAAVHPGGSGGAVVNSHGHMIGLVTSNARHSGGSVIPFLNFSVPFAALAPIFDFASKGGADFTLLSELDKPDKFLSAVWALVPSTPPRPPLQRLPTPVPPHMSSLPQTLPNSQNDPQKGSRFAKFFTEKSSELSLQQPLQPEKSRLIPRKLIDLQAIYNSSFNGQFCSRL